MNEGRTAAAVYDAATVHFLAKMGHSTAFDGIQHLMVSNIFYF